MYVSLSESPCVCALIDICVYASVQVHTWTDAYTQMSDVECVCHLCVCVCVCVCYLCVCAICVLVCVSPSLTGAGAGGAASATPVST